MGSSKVIRVFEHSTLKAEEGTAFTPTHFAALERYGYATREKYFSVGNKRIKFTKYVGVIQVRNLTIEVLPKADLADANEATKRKWHNALISMLQECKLLKLDSTPQAKLKLKSASLLDLYYDSFLSETEGIVRHGLRKSYRTVEGNLKKVKGKILFTQHARKNLLHKERFYVEHKVFDSDNKLNQILLKALLILGEISNNAAFATRIKKLLLHFEGVQERNITEAFFEGIRFDRNSERYRQALSLAKLIILRYSPDLKGGSENILAIMFDMNTLFESYVYRKLKALETDPDIPISRVQGQNRLPFWESRGIRADILLETAKGNFVIDTKWKILNDSKPSDEDLRQMFVYNLHYDANLSILLYPKTSLDTGTKKPFKKKEFENQNCQIAFIDIFSLGNNLDKRLGYSLFNNLLREEVEKTS